jgi:hypothetical protein
MKQRMATALLGLGLALGPAASAGVQEGQPAPDFTKDQLDTPAFGQVTPRSLSESFGKVIFLFVLGYG